MQVSTFYQFLSQPKTSLPGKGYPLGGIQKLPIQLSTHPVSETILNHGETPVTTRDLDPIYPTIWTLALTSSIYY